MKKRIALPVLCVLLVSTVAYVAIASPLAPVKERAWSKPVGNVSARLVVTSSNIRESENFRLTLELKNTGVLPLGVPTHNPHLLTFKILDSAGKSVGRSSSRIDVISSPQWGVIPRDGYLGFPVTIRSPDRAKGSHIDITTSIWKLPPGKYRVSGEYSSERPLEFPDLIPKSGKAPIWMGKVNLPALDLEIRRDGAEKQTASSPDTWSKPVNDIRARLRIAFVEDGAVHLENVGAVPLKGHIPRVEFNNTSGRTLSVCNWFQVEAKLTGSDGEEIKKEPQIQHVSGSFIGAAWATVPRGAYVGWPADSRSHAFLSVYRFPNGDGFAYLAIGHDHWKLKPGRYSVESKLIAKLPSISSKPLKMPENHWSGEISLPPMVFVVTDEQVVAENQEPDTFKD